MSARRQILGIQHLATKLDGHLLHYCDDPDGIVLALPQNGLVIASIVSGMLHIPGQVFIAQSLRAPCRCPCIIGAVTESNVVHMDESVIARQLWPYRELRAFIEMELQVQRAEIARQQRIHRSGGGFPELTGRHVIFISDGTAASAALIASIESFRKLGAAKIAFTIPSDSRHIARDIEQRVDELIVTGHF